MLEYDVQHIPHGTTNGTDLAFSCKDADVMLLLLLRFYKPVFINCIRFMRCHNNKGKGILASYLFNISAELKYRAYHLLQLNVNRHSKTKFL